LLPVEIQFLISRTSILTSENVIVDMLSIIHILGMNKVKAACHNLKVWRLV